MIEGVLEAFFLADEDLTKGSNMECTVMSYALDLMYTELQSRDLHMPEHLQLNYDNTARAGENKQLRNGWTGCRPEGDSELSKTALAR